MARYRRKTYEVEARQFLGGNGPNLVAWMSGSGAYYLGGVTNNTGHWPIIMLPRRDGYAYDQGGKGDWVVRFGNGEFMFMQPEVFDETFEPLVGEE